MGLPRVLTESELRRRAPSIFATEAHGSRSPKYTFIPTFDVVRGLEKQGFFPVFAAESRTRDESRRGFAKHVVRFRQEQPLQVGDTLVELGMSNAHDGSGSFNFFAALLKLLCLNGMCVGANGKLDFRSSHTGNVLDSALNSAFGVAQHFPKVLANVAEMQQVRISSDAQADFAKQALEAKYGETAPVGVAEILRPRRYEESASGTTWGYGAVAKPDLYTTYNVIQENIIKGGQYGRTVSEKTGRTRTHRTRPVKSVNTDIALNKKLWDIATDIAAKSGAPLSAL